MRRERSPPLSPHAKFNRCTSRTSAHPVAKSAAASRPRPVDDLRGRIRGVSLTLPDGSVRKVSAGTTGADLAMAISPRLAKAALAVVVDDRLTDLSRPFEADARVRIITERDPEALHLYRHSTAHLLAAAVLELFPGTQCGIGPALDDGFYYDFVVAAAVRARGSGGASSSGCSEIAARDLPFVRELRPRRRRPRRSSRPAASRSRCS